MANSYLSRTLGTSTNAYKGTVSHWIKRSGLGSMGTFVAWDNGGTASNRAYLNLYNDSLYFYDQPTSTIVQTNRLLRDTSAWYHIVVGWDTSQATASDRVKIYVNGVQETSMATGNYPSQNSTLQFNTSGRTFGVGSYASSGSASGFFDGYQSHFAFVDGQQLTPTSFGSTDSTTGQWKFMSPSGVTWGTNGFHLKFENSGALGTDSSGNSNNYTVNGNLKQALDTPSNVYCTLNLLHSQAQVGGATFFNGNLKIETTAQGGGPYTGTTGTTMAFNKGKWYWEVKLKTAASTYPNVGVGEATQPITGANNYLDDVNNFNNINLSCYGTTGNFRRTGRSTQNLNVDGGFSVNDIVMVAFDYDNDKIWFGKNGTWFASGNPSTGANPNETGFISAITPNDDYVMPYIGDGNYSTSCGFEVNFGNGFFGTTAITSAGSNGNGSLFEYDVPTGFYALNTKNLNTYG